jgi:hypothetical protein
MPTPGSGADPHHQLADYGADMCTPFEEPSTKPVERRGADRRSGRQR